MTSPKATTSQKAIGIARGSYDRVRFNLIIESIGHSGPLAKEQARQIINGPLNTALEKLQPQVVFETPDSHSSFSVLQQHRWDEDLGKQIPSGYCAMYTLHFETKQVDKASFVMDVLTSVESLSKTSSISVRNPEFVMDPENRRKLQKSALKAAWEVVMERFKEECDILGQNLNELQVLSWHANYTDRKAENRSYMNACVAEDLPEMSDDLIQSGLASVEVSLEVEFSRI